MVCRPWIETPTLCKTKIETTNVRLRDISNLSKVPVSDREDIWTPNCVIAAKKQKR